MSAITYFQTYAGYNRWMNEKIYAVCATMPDELRKRDLGAFFRSVHGTLNHLLLGDRVWLGRFTYEPFVVASLDQELYSDFETLRLERQATDKAIGDFVASLTERSLENIVRYKTIANSQEQSSPLSVCLLHCFNHQTHHRGQITTLLNQTGYDSGVTDLLWFTLGGE